MCGASGSVWYERDTNVTPQNILTAYQTLPDWHPLDNDRNTKKLWWKAWFFIRKIRQGRKIRRQLREEPRA